MSVENQSRFPNEAQKLLASTRFRAAKEELLKTIQESSAKLRQVQPAPSSPEIRDAYKDAIARFTKQRGRDLYYPFLSSGAGAGPFVELLDGSVKYDMITGIGINFFGHSHPELMGELIDAVPADVMQGNLEPGFEATQLLDALVSRVGQGSRLQHGWLTTCGTMANEIALKIIRQKKGGATKVLAFRDCFAGRSTAMQEITDNPGYRQGQPVYGEAFYLPFYDPKAGLEASVAATLGAMKEHLARFPGKFAAIMTELVQGEGGFNAAPREWYVRVFTEAKNAGLAVWVDEIQTFGRTGELFAYQYFGVSELVDVVTVAKMLQLGAVLFTDEYNPKPGLVAGTYSGATGALRAGRRSLELLEQGGYLGKGGKISKLSARFVSNLEAISQGKGKGKVSDIRAIGAMVAFQPGSGSMDHVKQFLMKLFDLGVVAFYCGHGPYLIRMLPPLGAMSEKEIDEVTSRIESALEVLPGESR